MPEATSDLERASQALGQEYSTEQARRGNAHSVEAKIRAATMMAAGVRYIDIAEELGVAYGTVSRWANHDPEFHDIRTRLTDAVIQANVQELRALSTEAIDALRRGLASSVREQAVVVNGKIKRVKLRDDSLAVRSAELTLKRIAEFAEQSHIDVSGSLLEHWMSEAEEAGELVDDGDRPALTS